MAHPVDTRVATAATDKPSDPVTPALQADRSGIGGHPRGLTTLFFTELWERFSYYGMRALLLLYMVAPADKGGLAMDAKHGAAIYGLYTFSVYFTSIPGGWIADQLLGQRAAVLLGGILIAMGHFSMALNILPMFYAGLVIIVLGTGLLKPNISTIVGQLYEKDDPRRDGGFSIFYMGINLGALIAPLICGYLGQKVGWHWGFGSAGVGMTIGVIQFAMARRRLRGKGELLQRPPNAGTLWAGVLASLVATALALYFLFDYKLILVVVSAAAFFVWLASKADRGIERKRVIAIMVLFVFATLFWAGFEQAGSSLNLFADRVTRTSLFGWNFPSSWFQSVQPLFIILLAPVFAALWVRMGPKEPSSPAKFAYGLLFVGLGFLILVPAASMFESTGVRVSPMWLVTLYFLHTVGELVLSPVGLSTVTKLAPERMVSSMMGVWFLSIALGNMIGGEVAGLFETFPLPRLFAIVFATTAVSAVILALLVKPIRRLMSGVH
jgi:proton-dependent oligopeptide transporter, POT family